MKMIQNIDVVPENGRNPVWFNGKLIPFEEATVHVVTHANNYGTAVFEGVRVYDTCKGTSLFHLNEHIDRLLASAQKLGIESLYSKAEIITACIDTVKASGQSRGYIRPQLQFGLSSPGLGKTNVVEMSIFFWPMGNYRESEALTVVLSDIERISPKAGDIEAKVMGFYTNSHFNYRFAHSKNADDAIMLDVNGNVAEASSSNIFLVKNNEIITPKTGYILKGITRKSILELVKKELGLPVLERIIKPEELNTADEIFLTGTAAQIDPVTTYNNKLVGNGQVGIVTSQLQALYDGVTHAANKNHLDWHTFV
jgi:branched-chain amino acid aminotransferase